VPTTPGDANASNRWGDPFFVREQAIAPRDLDVADWHAPATEPSAALSAHVQVLA
jgi:hypothetical protein